MKKILMILFLLHSLISGSDFDDFETSDILTSRDIKFVDKISEDCYAAVLSRHCTLEAKRSYGPLIDYNYSCGVILKDGIMLNLNSGKANFMLLKELYETIYSKQQ